jgi:Flp pilus assembly protein TadB
MTLDSNMLDEVKKRRGKASPVNIYQRLVLLVGAAVLVFAVWTTPASIPAVGVIGTTLLIFFILKDSKEKQDKGKRIDPKETLPEAGQNVDLREMLSQAGENVNPQEMLAEAGRNVDLQEMLSEPEEKERVERVV